MKQIKLIWITPDAEHTIVHCARVSNSSNQDNRSTGPRLLKYLVKHGHWSPFEMASACIEIKTTRAISAQLIRHRSFSFQEFSQRYSKVEDKPIYSTMWEDCGYMSHDETIIDVLEQHTADCYNIYNMALNLGLPKEVAREVLPLATPTTVYMSGTMRSWMHYLQARLSDETQVEHRIIADNIWTELVKHVPVLMSFVASSVAFQMKEKV